MKLDEFKAYVIAQRLAENKVKRNANLNAIMSVANATITNETKGQNK